MIEKEEMKMLRLVMEKIVNGKTVRTQVSGIDEINLALNVCINRKCGYEISSLPYNEYAIRCCRERGVKL